MNKLTLPRTVSMPDAKYTLVYVPDSPDFIQPDFTGMRVNAADCTEVDLPSVGRRFMTWAVLEQPAKIGASMPPRHYFALRIYTAYTGINMCPLSGMVIYTITPNDAGASLAQKFVNAWLGSPEQARPDDWAKQLFTVEKVKETPDAPPAPAADAEAV